MEILLHFSSHGFPWSVIVDYTVKYFQKYQDTPKTRPPEEWTDPDSELVSTFLTLLLSNPLQYDVTTKTSQYVYDTRLSDEIYTNYNHEQTGVSMKLKLP